MNTMTILALDLGTQTGWALTSRDGSITSGSQSFKPQRFEGGGMRFLRFKRWLTDIKQCNDGIDQVVFEEVRRHLGVDAAHAYGGFMGQLTAWCEHHQIPYQGIPVGTIKKHATGKGNASKDEMVASVRARGHAPTDANEADAIALLYLAREMATEGVCHESAPIPLPLPLGQSAAHHAGSGRGQTRGLAHRSHPGGQRARRTARLG